MRSVNILALGAFSSVVTAQQTLYGQCGGIGWTGATSCASGSHCAYSNAYYSQCLPGSGSGATTTAATTATTPKTSSEPPVSTKTTNSGSFSYLISFGDSYSQTGFTPSGAHASSSNPLGNPAFPGYTTSGGDNWIGYLLEKYNKGLLLSYNFAYGGATTDSALVTPFASTVLSLVNQVSEFSTYLANKPSYAPWTSSNALFAVWIGVNDVGNAWGKSNWSTLAPEIIARYISQLQILYNAGARNFLILTVPPIQRTPLVQAESSSTITNEGAAVVTYNNLLTAAVSKFKSSNSGVTTYVYDTSAPFNTALNNPTAYGAPNNLCYNSDGKSCLWWNNYHPGQAIHNLVAQGVASLTGL